MGRRQIRTRNSRSQIKCIRRLTDRRPELTDVQCLLEQIVVIKRSIMSQAAQLFDPLAGSGADQDLHPGHLVTRTFPVNDIDADRWQNFLDDLPRADIKVPRWLMITGPDDPSWRSMDSWMPPKKHTKQRCICEREKIVSGIRD